MSRTQHLGLLTLLIAAFFTPVFAPGNAPARAANDEPAERAKAFITDRHGALLEILKRPKTSARDKEIGALLESLLDYERIAESSLGAGWKDLNEGERERFEELLSALIERSYISSLEETKDFAIKYLGSREDGAQYLVETEARDRKNRRAPPIAMNYALVREGERFRVVDIVTDGVSLVNNYRNQFSRILAREGFDALVSKMEERLEQG